MKDRVRISGGNGKSSRLMCPSTYAPTDFAAFLTDLKAGNVLVDVTATPVSDGGVSEMGTALNKANLLTDDTAAGFGFSVEDDPTINDVLERIGADYLTGTLAAGSTSLTLTDTRIKTTSKYDIYTSKWTAQPVAVTVSAGSMVMTFDSQSEAVTVEVRVY